ncbi:MAG: hypothetical protein KTR28_02070 [Micavibrio sp.]|nr:hypothetical protein [Micavibrio sp.]
MTAVVCILALPFYFTASTIATKKAEAQCWQTCFYYVGVSIVYVPTVLCGPWDCVLSALLIPYAHSTCVQGRGFGVGCINTYNAIIPYMRREFGDLKDWLLNDFGNGQIVRAMRHMTRQLNAVTMTQTFAIGNMMDAQNMMETQNQFKLLELEATEDYRPSTGICKIGTAMRSLSAAENGSLVAKMALNERQMSRHLGDKGVGGAIDAAHDKQNRWVHFLKHYCDPQDNNWSANKNGSGLDSICEAEEEDRQRVNIDIDYTRAVENRRTFDIYAQAWIGSGDEIDIMALGNNLYGHKTLRRELSEINLASDAIALKYLDLRSIAAKRNIAENTFNSIVGMKSQGSSVTFKFLGNILQELGIPQNELMKYEGLKFGGGGGFLPTSQYATLEILSKKIFQNPTFYTQLYDTPANVSRKGAALKAIDLMLDRAIYESQLRREMAMSVLLSSRIGNHMSERSNIMWEGAN